jgi:inosine-uridine nucleoside N-ribohydrolase
MPLPPPYDRFAQKPAEREHAVDFIIRTIRQYPNEVTVYCGGPLTNLALAVLMAPDIVPITREVVFMGGGIHHSTSSFNVYFDAEAAKVAFRAGFPKFSVVTVDLAETMHMGDAGMVDEIVAKAPFPIGELFRRYEQPRDEQGRLVVDPALLKHNPNLRWFRLPDEMMAAQIIDPSVFGGYDEMYVDVMTFNNGHYGSTQWWDRTWPERLEGSPLEGQNRPSPRARIVHVLRDLDKERFRALFVGLMTKPIRKV